MTSRTLILPALVALALPAAAADFSTWDTNRDGSLDSSEFATGLRGVTAHHDWDQNADGRIDQDEFGTRYDDTALYDAWDRNADGTIDEGELGNGSYERHDADRSGLLNEPEADPFFKGSTQ